MPTSSRRLVLAVVLLAGCGTPADPHPPRQPVRGTLLYNGKPPVGAVVTLWPLPLEAVDWRTVKPAGGVTADGGFRVNSYTPEDGAVAGQYAVTVVWTGETDDPAPDLFRGKFANPKAPVATVTVADGQNELPPIKLTGPAVAPPRPAGGP